ncbi:MAG TPA: DUF4349 domain-containing protein [Thermoanaerobaculia bacterium]|nr:DUF4349 domain-containing protein [Thermoanaerobaculia bacterium]
MKLLRLRPLLVLFLVVVAALGGLLLRARSHSRSGAMNFAGDALAGGFLRQTSAKAAASAEVVGESPSVEPDALGAMFAARKLIRSASVTLEVARYGDAAARVEAIAAAHGGYLADASATRDAGDRQSGTVTVRVRADRFEEALKALQALGKVESARMETQDVGKEYFDLETRLAAKRDTEARLREILRTKTARLSDVIMAEKELARVIEERETLEGQRLFYDRQLALSTITAELHEPQPFLRGSALAPLREALGQALPLLSASAAALVSAMAAALPWALVALVAWWLYRRLATRRVVRLATER